MSSDNPFARGLPTFPEDDSEILKMANSANALTLMKQALDHQRKGELLLKDMCLRAVGFIIDNMLKQNLTIPITDIREITESALKFDDYLLAWKSTLVVMEEKGNDSLPEQTKLQIAIIDQFFDKNPQEIDVALEALAIIDKSTNQLPNTAQQEVKLLTLPLRVSIASIQLLKQYRSTGPYDVSFASKIQELITETKNNNQFSLSLELGIYLYNTAHGNSNNSELPLNLCKKLEAEFSKAHNNNDPVVERGMVQSIRFLEELQKHISAKTKSDITDEQHALGSLAYAIYTRLQKANRNIRLPMESRIEIEKVIKSSYVYEVEAMISQSDDFLQTSSFNDALNTLSKVEDLSQTEIPNTFKTMQLETFEKLHNAYSILSRSLITYIHTIELNDHNNLPELNEILLQSTITFDGMAASMANARKLGSATDFAMHKIDILLLLNAIYQKTPDTVDLNNSLISEGFNFMSQFFNEVMIDEKTIDLSTLGLTKLKDHLRTMIYSINFLPRDEGNIGSQLMSRNIHERVIGKFLENPDFVDVYSDVLAFEAMSNPRDFVNIISIAQRRLVDLLLKNPRLYNHIDAYEKLTIKRENIINNILDILIKDSGASLKITLNLIQTQSNDFYHMIVNTLKEKIADGHIHRENLPESLIQILS
jgi:hypothetical protein